VVGIFLIGCALLLLGVGCAGTSSETSKKEQGHTEATTTEQARSPQATESEEEARCEGTRTYHLYIVWYPAREIQKQGTVTGSEEDMKKADKKAGQRVDDLGVYTTNDLPGCPKGGLLEGTDGPDTMNSRDGVDKIRGLGAKDELWGGDGNDVIYGGPGNDDLQGDMVHEKNADVIYGGDGDDSLGGGEGADVLYGGDGNDSFAEGGAGKDVYPDEFYCGKGKDEIYDYVSSSAGKNDYVSSSCEKKHKPLKPVQ
jgi:Ca2+-binding RTX toxin-like protein